MEPSAERCRVRWAIDVEAEMDHGRFQQLLELLPADERQQVAKFMQPVDQHRALTSRVLQRCCVCQALGVEWREVTLALTKGRKPFTTNGKPPWAPNFNYNVSHEWGLLKSMADDEARREVIFQRLWSLKEAFVKARGDGLGFHPLSRAAFCFPDGDPWARSAHLTLDGESNSSWHFELHDLDDGHCVSVALGPPAEAVDADGAFKSTLRLKHVIPATVAQASPRPFALVSLEQILSTCRGVC
ncbi:hypothetical protein GPECTOR_1g263 [Gonium pectorale]|uniref:holo-[acyl-carrier-protein] synthase n=1 Tax=Gonium pectorale TaxID=33097 RepID=A0A150H2C5_GONPE|nr:hypothetical protein GPECTOR_1g263 [Gonium pectorale]|eukprot:KXZ56299.1 hypothetical protein GPECTOR_1g263 [Gonium pectorale]